MLFGSSPQCLLQGGSYKQASVCAMWVCMNVRERERRLDSPYIGLGPSDNIFELEGVPDPGDRGLCHGWGLRYP